MISEIDEALKSLVRAEALDGSADVDVVLDAPTKDWAARRNAPTVNLYLYDIREDLRRREAGWLERTSNGVVVSRQPLRRWFKMSYLVTAWTQRPEDEHRLLAALMRCFLRYDAMPPGLLPDSFAEVGVIPMRTALPPPEDRAFADVWTALGGELKPSLDMVVIAPLDAGLAKDAGAPVSDGAYLSMDDLVHGGSDGGVHRHVAPAASAAAIARLGPDHRLVVVDDPDDEDAAGGAAGAGGSGGGSGGAGRGASGAGGAGGAGGKGAGPTAGGTTLALGRGRKPRNQKRS